MLTVRETAMLHGAVAWLVAVPILLVMASLGAAAYLGTWYGGLAGMPAWAVPGPAALPDPSVAVAAVTALLLGLVGGVIVILFLLGVGR